MTLFKHTNIKSYKTQKKHINTYKLLVYFKSILKQQQNIKESALPCQWRNYFKFLFKKFIYLIQIFLPSAPQLLTSASFHWNLKLTEG